MRLVMVLWVLLMCSVAVADFDEKDIEQLEKLEQQDVLGAARTAADKWDFPTAERYVAQAKQKSTNEVDVKAVEQLIADVRSSKSALLEKVRDAAKSYNFSDAETYLAQVKQKSGTAEDVKTLEQFIADSRTAKADKEREEKEAAAAQAQATAQAQAAANQQAAANNSAQEYQERERMKNACLDQCSATKNNVSALCSGMNSKNSTFFHSSDKTECMGKALYAHQQCTQACFR